MAAKRIGRISVLVLLCSACSRVIHPAAVQPGLAIDVLPGIERQRHEPAARSSQNPLTTFAPFSTNQELVQFALSYGWRLSDQIGVQLAASGGGNVAPALDGYAQLLSRPFDAGGGFTLAPNGEGLIGLSPGVYAMVGKGWSPREGRTFRIDTGIRWEAVNPYAASGWAGSLNPFLLISLGGGRPGLSFGVWIDGRWYSRLVSRSTCQDSCNPDDLVISTTAAGLFLRILPRAGTR